MNARFMRKGMGAHDRFPNGDRTTCRSSPNCRKSRQLRKLHVAASPMETIQARSNFFKSCIAGALSQAEYTNAGMSCPPSNCRKRIRRGQTKIIVAMELQLDSSRTAKLGEYIVNRKRLHVAERVRITEAMSTCACGCFHGDEQKVHVGATG